MIVPVALGAACGLGGFAAVDEEYMRIEVLEPFPHWVGYELRGRDGFFVIDDLPIDSTLGTPNTRGFFATLLSLHCQVGHESISSLWVLPLPNKTSDSAQGSILQKMCRMGHLISQCRHYIR